MKIEYLHKLENNLTIGVRTSKGVSENDIRKVERKFKIEFPTSYKEFLYLAGGYAGGMPLLDTSELSQIAADWHQEIMNEELEETKTKIDRPFWLFAESDACEVFLFFYLDDGDDPMVHFAT